MHALFRIIKRNNKSYCDKLMTNPVNLIEIRQSFMLKPVSLKFVVKFMTVRCNGNRKTWLDHIL